jgi:hypothetical protein
VTLLVAQVGTNIGPVRESVVHSPKVDDRTTHGCLIASAAWLR